MIPILQNYLNRRRRPANVVGGQRGYINKPNLYGPLRSSPLSDTSANLRPGRFVAFDNAVAINNFGQYTVQAVDTAGYTFVAADFAGIASVVHEDRLNRAAIPQLASDPTVYANIFEHTPGNYVPRAVMDDYWVETDLAAAPAPTDAVNVLPDGRASNAGGVALPVAEVVFTGEFETGFDGLNYVKVLIRTIVAR